MRYTAAKPEPQAYAPRQTYPGTERAMRRVRGKRRRALWLAIALGALVAAALSCAVFASGQAAQHDETRRGGGAAFGNEAPVSTPKTQWKRGVIPHLYQTDPAWSHIPYAGSDLSAAGCGPTCMAMAYAGLTGKSDRDPAAMAAFSEQGGFVDAGMTSWAFMTEGAAQLGLDAEELPADANAVMAALREGRPVIASVRPGDFTTEGHFIVLAGVDENGGVTVRDPNSPERSARTWSAQRIVDQCANLWSYRVR